MAVSFVGAGPGAPDLITLRGRKLLNEADLIIYAGSLVNPSLLEGCKAKCIDSANLHLEEIIELMDAAHKQGKKVVRLHTGDPSIYGAIREQMHSLEQRNVPYDLIPGVSSANAAAAALKAELTLPEISQTVIITRQAGRTPVPDKEQLHRLAAHQATMLIFLSVSMMNTVVKELLLGGYPATTSAAVVEKASWPEQKIIQGTLENIAQRVEDAGIKKTAIIAIGNVFAERSEIAACSKLYDRHFSHEYRQAEQPGRKDIVSNNT